MKSAFLGNASTHNVVATLTLEKVMRASRVLDNAGRVQADTKILTPRRYIALDRLVFDRRGGIKFTSNDALEIMETLDRGNPVRSDNYDLRREFESLVDPVSEYDLAGQDLSDVIAAVPFIRLQSYLSRVDRFLSGRTDLSLIHIKVVNKPIFSEPDKTILKDLNL